LLVPKKPQRALHRKEGKMKAQIVVNPRAKEVAVASECHPGFASGARRLGGEWHKQERVWTFPLEAKDRVLTLARECYGNEVWEGLLPRKEGPALYRVFVHPEPERWPSRPGGQKGVLLAVVYEETDLFPGRIPPEVKRPRLKFVAGPRRRAGRLSLGPDRAGYIPPETCLPEEAELALRWGEEYASPLLRELPPPEAWDPILYREEEKEKVLRFVERGSLGECPACGGPLWEDPYWNRELLCVKCGRTQAAS